MNGTPAKQEAERPTSVLIVEDEWMVAWDLERSLKEMGYQVIATVDSSAEALRVAAEQRPDVALMDIRINGDVDGITTAIALSERHGVPVVYLTAYTDDLTLARAVRTRAYGYVVKPFTSREVRSAIEVARHKHAADMKVARSERWLSTTLRSIGDAVVACDPDHRVQFMNRVAEALTGWKEADARGRLVDDVVQIRAGDAARSPLREALAERAPRNLPPGARLVPRGGQGFREIDDSAAPIEHQGEVLGAVLCFRDVTEQRRLQRQAEAADRLASLGLMAATVGHEINNPLAIMQSNMVFLSAGLDRVDAAVYQGELDPELASHVEEMVELVDEVRVGTERIRQVVTDLNVFGRPASEQRTLVDPREVLQWALRVTANQVRQRGRIDADLQPTGLVVGSEVWLGQVFVNLLVNAVHALPAGSEVRNEIRVWCGTAADGRALVSVSDNGRGLAPEEQARVFTPSFAARGRGPGSGLGLPISHTLVTALGGEIRVKSAPDQGTTFEVLLPVAPPEADPLDAAGPLGPPNGP